MPAIRVIRTVQAKPGKLGELMSAAFELAKHAERDHGIKVELFCNRFGPRALGGLMMFMDFASMAEYESIFLGKIVKDGNYLATLASAAAFIHESPHDELVVRLAADDYLMNLG